MRIAAISAVAGAGSLPAGAALAAGAVGLDWWGDSLRLALSLTLVFASAGIGFWLARLRVARHTEALDAALEALPQPRQMVDRQGRVITANAACRQLLGDRPAPLQNVLAQQLSIVELKALQDLAQSAALGGSGQMEVEAALGPSLNGPKPLLVGASAIPGHAGAVLWRIEDISRHRAADDAVSSEYARQSRVVEEAPVGFYTLDEGGCILKANARFAGWIGITSEAL